MAILVARIRGGETYRIWGTKGSGRRLDLQVYAGQPWARSDGRSAAALAMEDIHFAFDGTFEITLSAERVAGNWLENPHDATEVMLRQIFSDWRTEVPGEVHIDRVGDEGKLKPPLTAQEAAGRLDAVAEQLKQEANCWPEFLNGMHIPPANTLSPAASASSKGGMEGRYMSFGVFDLAADEALVVRMWPSPANYQGIQLMDDWMARRGRVFASAR